MRRLADQPREHAGRRVGQRLAARIVHRHLPARQRRQHPARQRAVRRHQRRGFARRLVRLAQRHRDGQRLLLGARRLDHRQRRPGAASAWASKAGSASRALPRFGRRRRPQRLRQERARGRAMRSADSTSTPRASTPSRAQEAHACANCGWPGGLARPRPPRRRSAARTARRDHCRGPAGPRRHGQDRRWFPAARPWTASSRSSRPRSPVRADWRKPRAVRPRSAGRAAAAGSSLPMRGQDARPDAARAILRNSSVSCQ